MSTSQFSVKGLESGITAAWLRSFIKKNDIDVQCRPYQERIIVRCINMIILEGVDSILIESATGSGKTIIGLLIVRILKDLKGYGSTWTTMRANLLSQTRERDQEKRILSNPSTVSMFMRDPDQNDVLIVDEAHHDCTTSMANIHSKVKPRIVILLSATPIRPDKCTIFYQKSIRDAGIRSLIREGWLSGFDHWTIEDWKPSTVASAYLKDPDKWGKTCVFFHTEQQCLEFRGLLNAAGHDCELITAKTDRDSQLDRFMNPDSGLNVVVNMMILTEGFDYDALDTVFVRPSSKSPTIQMGGRVLRVHGDKTKNIIQSKDSKFPFSREANPKRKMLLEGESWRAIGVNDKVDTVVVQTLTQIMGAEPRSPSAFDKYMAKRKKKNGYRGGRQRDTFGGN